MSYCAYCARHVLVWRVLSSKLCVSPHMMVALCVQLCVSSPHFGNTLCSCVSSIYCVRPYLCVLVMQCKCSAQTYVCMSSRCMLYVLEILSKSSYNHDIVYCTASALMRLVIVYAMMCVHVASSVRPLNPVPIQCMPC
jgi:hypothetical protein